MIITNYNEFIKESVLVVSDNLSNILKEVDHPISKYLLSIKGKEVGKIDFNFLDLANEVSNLIFTSDTQAQRKKEQGKTDDEIFLSGGKSSIGRIVGQILRDTGFKHKAYDIDRFAILLKSEIKWEQVKSGKIIVKIVEGKDITFWYSEKNYSKQTTTTGRGHLSSSCMREDRCKDFFSIYEMNPGKVKLVIHLDDEGKLLTRALVWDMGGKHYLDRVYFTYEEDMALVRRWVEKVYLKKSLHVLSLQDKIILDNSQNLDGSFDKYPFMDTFKFYYPEEKKLQIKDPGKEIGWLILQSTTGGYEAIGMVYCAIEDGIFPEDDCVYSQTQDFSMLKENAVYSDFYQDWLYKEDTVYSKIMKSYLLEPRSLSFWLDLEKKEMDHVDMDEIGEYCVAVLEKNSSGEYFSQWYDKKLYDDGQITKTIDQSLVDIFMNDFPPDKLEVDNGNVYYKRKSIITRHEAIGGIFRYRSTFLYDYLLDTYDIGMYREGLELYFKDAVKKYYEKILLSKNIKIDI